MLALAIYTHSLPFSRIARASNTTLQTCFLCPMACHATLNLLPIEIPLVFMIETRYTNSLQLRHCLKHLDTRNWCLRGFKNLR